MRRLTRVVWEIRMFARSPEARLEVFGGGHHFRSASEPGDVDSAALEFVTRRA